MAVFLGQLAYTLQRLKGVVGELADREIAEVDGCDARIQQKAEIRRRKVCTALPSSRTLSGISQFDSAEDHS